HLSGLSYRLMMALGPQRLSRDIRLVHDSLLAEGRAVWLGDNFAAKQIQPLEDIESARQAVYSLFSEKLRLDKDGT
ncbi:MAG: hypothetical protein V3W04_03500, partial [Gammaproteobacteria bacterium]